MDKETMDSTKPNKNEELEPKKSVVCRLCNLTLKNDEKEKSKHFNGKKHLERQKIVDAASKQVFVNGSIEGEAKKNFEDVLRNQFGDIESCYYDKRGRFVIATFKDVKSAEKAIKSRFEFRGRKMRIVKKRVEFHQQPTKKKQKTKQESVPSQLQIKGSFDVQLQSLIEAIKTTPERCKSLELLYFDLQNALNDEYENCHVVPFGSAITGMGFTDSDVDCFIFLHPEHMESMLSACKGDVDTVQRRLVNNTKGLLFKNRNIFANVLSIPRASVPIVKFLHLPSKISCDVSFKNGFGVHNSKLISFILTSDPRLKPLFMFVKYWMKCHDLLGYGRFTSYSIIMLTISYLQQISPSVLIPIINLQRDKKFDIYIDNWNCGFDYITPLPKSENTSSVLALLQGFFGFYKEYDFENNVICPFVGKSYSIADFDNRDNLLPAYTAYVNRVKSDRSKNVLAMRKPAYVQDPFEHSRNITCNVSEAKLNYFAAHCKCSYDHIEAAVKSNNYDNLVNKLLKQTVPNMKNNAMFIKIHTKEFKHSNNMPQMVVNTRILFQRILNDVLKCTFDLDFENDYVQNKVSFYVMRFICSMSYNVWQGRNALSESSTAKDPLEKEVEITDSLMKISYKDIIPKEPLFSCVMDVNVFDNHLKLSTALKSGIKNEYKLCFSFLFSRLARFARSCDQNDAT